MTISENEAEVKAHFRPKQPKPKIVIDPKVVQHFVEFIEWSNTYVENRSDDYERTIEKLHEEKELAKKGLARSGKSIPQLVEQSNQSTPPPPRPAQGVFR
jgi:hypothetical protein